MLLNTTNVSAYYRSDDVFSSRMKRGPAAFYASPNCSRMFRFMTVGYASGY
jgi:hypothetical protein